MKRNYSWITVVILILLAFCQVGAILKGEGKEAAIEFTQTDPIAYKAKVEEEKDGVKGAPSPTFKYYGDEDVLARLPMDRENKEESKEAGDALPLINDPIPENVRQDGTNEDDWWFKDWDDPAFDDQ